MSEIENKPQILKITPYLQRIFDLRPDFFEAQDLSARPDAQKQAAERRKQAATIYPFLAPLFPTAPILSAMIDNSAPIGPSISTKFGIGKSALKRINGLELPDPTPDPTSIEDHRLRSHIVNLIDSVDPNQMPRTDDEKRAFFETLLVVGHHLGTSIQQPLPQLLAAAKGKWPEFLKRLWKSAYPPEKGHEPEPYDFHALKIAADDVRDISVKFAHEVLLPAISIGNEGEYLETGTVFKAYDAANDILFGNKSAAAILEISHYWHRGQGHAAPRNFTFDDPDHNWPAITPEFNPDRDDGLVLRCLTNSGELEQESQRMHHCVRGYSSSCSMHGSIIVSVQSADHENSYLTAELRIAERDPLKVTVVQVRGLNNREPSAEAREVYDAFLERFKKGELPLDYAMVDAHKADMEKLIEERTRKSGHMKAVARDPVIGYCGFDYTNRDAMLPVLESWFPTEGYSWVAGRGTPRTIEEVINALPQVQMLIHEIHPESPYLPRTTEVTALSPAA